jgi:hypothetical protein
VVSGKGPLEWSSRRFIAILEGEQGRLQLSQRIEVIGRENLSLNYGEIDFDLVQPAGVDGRADRNNRRPAGLQTLNTLVPAVR